MDTFLVKVFATALTLSQVTTTPEKVHTVFDRVADQANVVSLLRDGCIHIRQVFEIEDVDLEDLLATAMQDVDLIASGNAAFRGIKFTDLQSAYRQFCTSETAAAWDFDAGEVIDFYNKTVADLPDPARLKGLKLSGETVVLDGKGGRFAQVFDADQRRVWVPLNDVPEQVRQAFVSAEDKRFYHHHGIDERGLIRAVVANLARPGRPQGASTITQQVVKNLLVGDDVTYERKIREIILTSQVERVLSKDEILELYLNSIYLGRSSWGIEMAARSYFGKSAKDLTLSEGALLAGLPKGPSYFSPDRYPGRVRERHTYVLDRMEEDGAITPEAAVAARAAMPALVAYERPRRDFGFHFADQVVREARALAAANGAAANSYIIHSTINVPLQRGVEEALQEGLSRYERNSSRVHFQGPEANLRSAIARLQGEQEILDKRPAWQRALANARLPLYDVHWTPATVLETGSVGRAALRIGLSDGRILPLAGDVSPIRRTVKPYDVIFIRLSQGRNSSSVRAELRVRPEVQGAVIVLDNKSGGILAMTGAFSYPLSQLNRATQAQRQPGSAIKPLTYLAALENGLEPNTLIRDEPITFPPIGGRGESWSPKNYEGGGSGILTLRQALENSRNLATVHLLEGGIEAKPQQSLDRVCELALKLGIYRDCIKFYPFVLGAEPVRPIDLAAFYAAIANEGARPEPHAVDAIELDGKTYARGTPPPASLSAGDQAVFYQLKTMLQGVVQRGTARAMAALSPFVAGKTGTTEDQNDAWFVGFTNEITIAVWVGYDNAGERRRTLGEGATGAAVAAPIFESIVRAAWRYGFSKNVLASPSAEAAQELSCDAIDHRSGELRGLAECVRVDTKGRPIDARYRLVSRERRYAQRNPDDTKPRRSVPANDPGRDTDTYFSSPYGGWSRDAWGGWGLWPFSMRSYESNRDWLRR
jgi:penicillin-binding protein 1A